MKPTCSFILLAIALANYSVTPASGLNLGNILGGSSNTNVASSRIISNILPTDLSANVGASSGGKVTTGQYPFVPFR